MFRIINWRIFGVVREMYFNMFFWSGFCLVRCFFFNFYYKWRFLFLFFFFKLGGLGLVKGYLFYFNFFYLMFINLININFWNCYFSWFFCVRFYFVMSINVKGVMWWFIFLVLRLLIEYFNNVVFFMWYVMFCFVGLKEGGMIVVFW